MEIRNKRAYFDYYVEKEIEAGLVLTGTEIKSIRKGSVDLKDSYVRIKNNEAYVINMYIAKYDEGNRFNHEERRTRKLLLHKKEIIRISSDIEKDGYTIIPLKLYIKKGKAKLLIGICKGKQLHDKRASLKEKEIKKEMNYKNVLYMLLFFFLSLSLFIKNVNALNKSVIDITKQDIKEISEALDLKLITSEELINLYLDRIEAYDQQYKSIISINENAIEEAKLADKLRSEGKIKSILHGIPIIVKDNIDVLGMPTTAGAKALKDNYPKTNSYVIQKLIDAGAIILAKSNMSEFAFQANISSSSYGTVKNAYNVEYSSYGSSGGSATSIAASFAAAALGTDTNSSIRLPAAAANLVGLRPSTGLLSRTGALPYDSERDTIGPITKTVSDSMIIMNIINSYDSSDSKSYKNDRKLYENKLTNLEGVTIGIPTDFLKGSNDNSLPENRETYSEIIKLMEVAINKLEKQKAKIVYLDKYYNYQTDSWFSTSLSGYLFCDSFNEYIKNTTGKVRSFKDLAESSGRVMPLDGYLSSCNSSKSTITRKNEIKKEYTNYIEEIMIENNLDFIAYPTSKNKLIKINSGDRPQNLSAHASSTIGYPSISLPLGFDSEGLPYGIEFMAGFKEEQSLFEVSAIYEKINGNKTTPAIAPSLYEIPNDVETLVTNYTKVYKKDNKIKLEKEWLEEVEQYFRNYSSNEDLETLKNLNDKYISNNIISISVDKGISIIKIIVIAFFILITILFIRKKIIKNTKLRKKRKKNIK